ncbi:MAG: long-chain fatty acid transport protein [Bradymonadia bacterium]|jgi:long-chain fatty acid transport protein
MRIPSRLAVFTVLLTAPCSATASGLDAPSIGAVFSGPLTRDAASLYHNPSLLVRLDRPTLLASLGVVAGSIGYTRDYRGQYQFADGFEINDPVAPEHLDASKRGPQSGVSASIFSPTADLFFALPINRSLALGFGFYAPYAAPVAFPDDGPQRFTLQEAFIAVTHLTAGVSMAFGDRFSAGVGVSYVFGTANLRRLEDFGSVPDFGDALANPPISQPNSFGADAPSTVRELDVLARPFSLTNAVAHAVTFNAGVTFAANDTVDLALTYQHGAQMDFEGDFALDMSDDLFTQDLAAQGLVYKPLIEGVAQLGFRLPTRIGAAVAVDVNPALRLEGRLAYITWSDLDAFDISLTSPDLAQPEFGLPATSAKALRRDWDDSVHLTVVGGHTLQGDSSGGDAAHNPTVLNWLVGYQSPASPDATVDAASPDGQRFLAGFGATFGFDNGMRLGLDTQLQVIAPRTVTASRFDLGNGEYTLFLASLGAHLTVPFGEAL